jgi:hypothetical protein
MLRGLTTGLLLSVMLLMAACSSRDENPRRDMDGEIRI